MVYGQLGSLIDLLPADPHLLDPNLPFRGISTDTRHLEPGCVFVALVGETFDGHEFIPQALAKGAVAVIAQRGGDFPHLRVEDTLLAYQRIAQDWRRRFAIPVIAITGSAGKTSTKEMMATALSRYGSVLKSQANFNNDIGVAQTLVRLDPSYDFVVLEMAMRGPGEIARLAATAEPTHGVITNVGSAHIGRLGSHAAIAQAKCELVAGLGKGVAILNGEDELLLQTVQGLATQGLVTQGLVTQGLATQGLVTQGVSAAPILTFGLDSGQIRGDWDPAAQTLTVGSLRLPIPLPGRHQALNWMAVVATLQQLGLDLARLQDPLTLPPEASGRNRRIALSGDRLILDETYNAAPEAVVAALHLLNETPGTRHWAILGPMRELGAFAESLYSQVGSVAEQLQFDHVWLLDPDGEMDPLVQQLHPQRVQVFATPAALTQALITQTNAGDRYLFKASRAVQLDTVVKELILRWQSTGSQDQ